MLLICITIKNETFKRVLIVFTYRKIPKISRGAYIFEAYFWRGLSMEGNLRLKIDWATLIVGRKFTVFGLFYFVFEGNFQVQAPRGAYIWRGDLTEGFLRYEFGGLIFGGAYTWRGLFSEVYGIYKRPAFLDLSSLRSLLLSYCLKPFLRRPYGHLRPLQGPY